MEKKKFVPVNKQPDEDDYKPPDEAIKDSIYKEDTDFEVHRNWMAITYNLPYSKWYTDTTSEWTLDYPPFFALFEYMLACIAHYIDPNSLTLTAKYEYSWTTVCFQRSTVILSDMVLLYSIYKMSLWCKKIVPEGKNRFLMMLTLYTYGNPGFLFVDHIHFQYNGLLFGIFILSIVAILEEKPFLSAFYYSVLLNFKHIFLYVAPVYFIYLFMKYCVIGGKKQRLMNFAKLSAIVLTVFTVSFGPYIYIGQLKQVLQRLFPFKRGLTHAYWAPNFWSVYNGLDYMLAKWIKWQHPETPLKAITYTSGIVQDTVHVVLPHISPTKTIIITVVSMSSVLWSLAKHTNPRGFMTSLIYCAMCSFMFGWHVHEKAILIVLIPLSIASVASFQGEIEAKVFFILNIVGGLSLFPLLYEVQEIPIKIIILVLHSYMVHRSYLRIIELNIIEKLYLLSCLSVQIIVVVVQPLLFSHLVYFPLMLTSLHCSIGIIYVYRLLFDMHYDNNTRTLLKVD